MENIRKIIRFSFLRFFETTFVFDKRMKMKCWKFIEIFLRVVLRR